jgi:hypothetical protein
MNKMVPASLHCVLMTVLLHSLILDQAVVYGQKSASGKINIVVLDFDASYTAGFSLLSYQWRTS